MKVSAIIPARFSSSRFPGKPLEKISGRPLIQWVYEAARGYSGFERVIVATDDERVLSACRA